MRRLLPAVLVVLLAAAGCALLGGGGLKPGDIVEGDLDTGMEIGDIIPDAEEVLLAAGIAVEEDWPAVEFPLAAGDDGISLYVEEDGIDPVIVVVDAEFNVLAAGDDWDEELDAFVSLDKVPAGAVAVVFDIAGDDGLFTIEADESSRFSWQLEMGDEIESFILEDKSNDLWEEMLEDVSDIYRETWETCTVMPLEVAADGWVRIAVESDEDCVMAILEVDDDDLDYIDYDDDTNGSNPAFAGELSQGTYVVVIDTYSGNYDAEFTIAVEEIDPDDMAADIVTVYQADEWYSGEFNDGAMVLSYWPEVGDFWGIYPEEQVVVFEFQIDEDGEYVFDAMCFDDTKMAIIDENSSMIDYNDDGPEGLDPQLTLQLSPGHYAALVTPYSEGTTETVDFMFTMAAPIEREPGYLPWDQTSYSDSNIYLSLVFEPGETYEIFAESNTDLTLTVTDTAGEVWFNDDDGGDFNPYLEIEATMENAGAWNLDIESYGGSGIGDEVRVVARPVTTDRIQNTSAPVDL